MVRSIGPLPSRDQKDALDSASPALSSSNPVTGETYTAYSNVVQQVRAAVATVVSCTTVVPYDDTIPQSTEGDEVITLAITPTDTSNILVIEFSGSGSRPTGSNTKIITALFRDSGTDAIAASQVLGTSGEPISLSLTHYLTAPSTSSQTYKIRVGGVDSGFYVNGDNTGSRVFGGVSAASLIITEIKP